VFNPLIRMAKAKVRAYLRERVESALARSEGHFYVYDPRTDRLGRISGFDQIGVLLKGHPVNPGYGDCHWVPYLDKIAYDGTIVFDVGGFRGYTAVWFARRARQVICFEPSPANQDAIREQIRIRGVGNVELVPFAVSDRAGRSTLHLKPRQGHHSLGDIGATTTIGSVEVETITLDQFAAERGIEELGLLKVDVEGFEPEVFLGAAGLLRRKAIGAIVFEFSPKFYRQRDLPPDRPLQVLADFGYRVEALTGDPFTWSDQHHGFDQNDLFAFPQL